MKPKLYTCTFLTLQKLSFKDEPDVFCLIKGKKPVFSTVLHVKTKSNYHNSAQTKLDVSSAFEPSGFRLFLQPIIDALASCVLCSAEHCRKMPFHD